MFSGASNFTQGVDTAFLFIIGISVFFLIAITVVMIWFIYRYSSKRHPVSADIPGNNLLELIWTIIPTILVLGMFWFGFKGYMPMRDIPDDALRVRTIARMWSWTFEYENGKRSPKLILPIDQPVVLDMISDDVIHSLYIPAFRVKEDVVPGRTNRMWFIPQLMGEYDLYCAEYCGLRHAYMLTTVHVVGQAEFDEWYAAGLDTTALDLVSAGFQILQIHGCGACHSSDGTKLVGSTFKDLYGSQVEIISGNATKSVLADEDYIRRAVYEPNAEIVKGYTPGLMPSYQGQVTETDMANLIEYLKSISKHAN